MNEELYAKIGAALSGVCDVPIPTLRRLLDDSDALAAAHTQAARWKRELHEACVARDVYKERLDLCRDILAERSRILHHEVEALKAEVARLGAGMRYRVYSGSEKLDLGDKDVSCLCESEHQAKHMVKFWGEFAYYEPIQVEWQEANPASSICPKCAALEARVRIAYEMANKP